MQDILFESFSEPYFKEIVEIDTLCFPKYPFPPEVLRNWINLGSVYILRTKSTDTCIGYIVLGKCGILFGKRRTPQSKKNTGYIHSLAVHPEFQRNGYGLTLLLKGCDAYLKKRGIEAIVVHTRVSNPARFLYEKAGFKKVQVCPQFYDGEDAIEFVLEVKKHIETLLNDPYISSTHPDPEKVLRGSKIRKALKPFA